MQYRNVVNDIGVQLKNKIYKIEETYKNKLGKPCKRSNKAGYENTFYCGKHLGKDKLPGSDGYCGPYDGPNCDACKKVTGNATDFCLSSNPFDFELDVNYAKRNFI